jgi:hypothetical protein
MGIITKLVARGVSRATGLSNIGRSRKPEKIEGVKKILSGIGEVHYQTGNDIAREKVLKKLPRISF